MEHTQGADSHLSPIAHISDHLLFARAYLRDLLAAPASAAIHACRQTIKEWRDSYPSLDDPHDCRSYIGQCLSSLGLSYQRRADGFTLYADDALAQPVGLCLHVADTDIGRATKGRHYQAMLVRELRQASLSWGMITNGQAWRLCHAASPAPYEAYVQADLDGLLDDRSVASFSLFCQFFGHDAFAVTTQPRDLSPRSGLDRRLAASEQRVEVVQRYLRSRVEPVLQSLCLGFVQDEAAATYSRQQLDDIYRNAIYLLYRILFVFYAEARDLLPTTNAGYRAIGLSSILDATRLRQQGVQDADPHSLWKRLTNLFVIVDDGDAALGISPYDGGLFSDTEKTYLKIHKIADYYLAPALFELGYMQNKSGAEPIDYRDLSVRHLGTLYEGLLEYRLNLVDREPVVVRESGGKRVYIPQSQAGPIKRTETRLRWSSWMW